MRKHTALRRVILLVLLALALSLTACGKKPDADDMSDESLASKTAPAEAAEFLAQPVEGDFTISCYDDNDFFLNPAIESFRLKYPEIKVNVQKFASALEMTKQEIDSDKALFYKIPVKDNQEKSDYIKMINTELMSGAGADILQIDVIPWYKYADAGCLEDLTPFMDYDPGFDKAALRTNIFDAISYKGGRFVLPLNFMFNFYAYDASFFNDTERQAFTERDTFTFEDMLKLSEPAFIRNNKQNSVFGYTGGAYHTYHIFNLLLRQHYSEFVNISKKQVIFNDGNFANLLLSAREYLDKGYIQETSNIVEAFVRFDIGTDYKNRIKEHRFLCKYEHTGFLLQNYSYTLVGSNYTLSPTFGEVQDDIIAGLAADSTGGIGFWSGQMYAINANSKNKRAAWEFLKFLTSEEPQSFFQLSLVPINRNALRENAIAHLTIGGTEPLEFTEETREAFEDYLVCVDKYSDFINVYSIRDTRIDMMIEEEVALYFDGKKTAEETAATLQNKVSLYLNE